MLVRTLTAAVLVTLGTAAPVAAQQVTGRVVLEGWTEPLQGATVFLMDDQLATVDSVTTGADGTYVMPIPGPGSYLLQAKLGPAFGPLSPTLELDADDRTDDLTLELPSPLFREALDCFAEHAVAGTGVLAGIVLDPNSEVPLPSARVTLEWDEDGARRSRDVVASETGFFVACAVPADVALTARVYSLGAVSGSHPGIVVAEGALARHDLALDLRGTGARLQVVGETGTAHLEGLSQLTGHLLDAETGQPIAAARVALTGATEAAVTGPDGRFRFSNLSGGSYTLDVDHLGYGQQSETFDIPGSSDVTVQIRVAARAIELDGLTVRARRETMPARMAGATSTRTVTGERLTQAQHRGAQLYQMLYELPGLRLNYSRPGGTGPLQVCAEIARGRPSFSGGCNMIEVFLDGTPVPRELAQELLVSGITDYERIELLPPLDAIRWGFRASEAGALFLWTARGPLPDSGR